MKAILVFDNNNVSNLRVLVQLTQKRFINQVIALLEQDRAREAFDILRTKGEVVDYLPRGRRTTDRPEIILFEDML